MTHVVLTTAARRRTSLAAKLVACALVAAFCALAFPPPVRAQDDAQSVFWRIRYDDSIDDAQRKKFEAELMGVLARAEQRHIVTGNAKRKHLERNPLEVPVCYEGLEACGSLPEQLVEALGVSGLVQGRLGTASGDTFALQLDYFRDFGSTKSVQKTGRLDLIVREAVAELFTIEAEIQVVTEPTGADVYFNGRLAGTSPVDVGLGEGLHAVRVEMDGYETHREEVSLTPGEQRTLEIALQPRLTQVTVLTGAPNAEVWIDGTFLGMAGDPIDVLPGEHEVELRAAGYRDIAIDFEIDAAERRTIELAMLRQVEDPWARRERALTRYPLFAEVGYNLAVQTGAFDGAVSDTDAGQLTGSDIASANPIVYNGFDVSAGWTHDNFGLWAIGASVLFAGLDRDIELVDDAGTRLDATGVSALRVGLYPLQPTARYVWGPFAIDARTGLGVGFDRFGVETDTGEGVTLTETSGFWNLAAGGRYYWAVEVDFAGGRNPRHVVLTRIGFNLPLLVDDGESDTDSDLPDTVEGQPADPVDPDDASEPDGAEGETDEASDDEESFELPELPPPPTSEDTREGGQP